MGPAIECPCFVSRLSTVFPSSGLLPELSAREAREATMLFQGKTALVPCALTRGSLHIFGLSRFSTPFSSASTSGLPEVSAREAREATMLFQGKTALVTGAGSVRPLRTPRMHAKRVSARPSVLALLPRSRLVGAISSIVHRVDITRRDVRHLTPPPPLRASAAGCACAWRARAPPA